MSKKTLTKMFVVVAAFVAAPVWADEPTPAASASSGTGAADESPKAKAQRAYEKGREAIKAEQWLQAEAAFEESLRYEASPKTAGQLGWVQVEHGEKYLEGARNLQWFLEDDMSVPQEIKDKVRPTLTVAKKNLATLKLRIEPKDADVQIDGVAVRPEQIAWPQYLLEGEHEFRATKPGFAPKIEKKQLAKGSEGVLELKLVVEQPAQQQVVRPETPKQTTAMPMHVKAAWIGGSVLAAVAIGTGIGAGVTYGPMEDAFNRKPTECLNDPNQEPCRSDYEALSPRSQALSVTAVVSGAVGLGALGYALVGTLAQRKEQAGIRIVPMTNGVVVVGTF